MTRNTPSEIEIIQLLRSRISALVSILDANGTIEKPEADVLLRLAAESIEALEQAEQTRKTQFERLLAHQRLLDRRILGIETSWIAVTYKTIIGRLSGLQRRLSSLFARATGRQQGIEGEQDLRTSYWKWASHHKALRPSAERQESEIQSWPTRPVFSILLVGGREDLPFLRSALSSIESQTYRDWEVCASIDAEVSGCHAEALHSFGSRTGKLRYVSAERTARAARWNEASRLAQGDYLTLIDLRDEIAPEALYFVAKSAQEQVWDLIYTDQDFIDEQGRRVQPLFKPDWSPHLLKQCMYMGGGMFIRRDFFEAAGGFRDGADGAEEYDLMLRLADRSFPVRHICQVLYHERLPSGESEVKWRLPRSHAKAAYKLTAEAGAREAIMRNSVESLPLQGASSAPELPFGKGCVTVVICSRTARLAHRCVNALRSTSTNVDVLVVHHLDGPNSEQSISFGALHARVISYEGVFDFSAMNNRAARLSTSPFLLFLNDDVIAGSPGWLEALLAPLLRPEVGIVGTILRYPDGTVQHAGVVTGIGDGAGHVGRSERSTILWPWLQIARDVSAVTGACMAIRRDVWDELGGFDTTFPNNYNDVDLCLRARESGYAVMCVPGHGLVHEECRSRNGVTYFDERDRFYARWSHVLRKPDPFYSTSLAPQERIAFNWSGEPEGLFGPYLQ